MAKFNIQIISIKKDIFIKFYKLNNFCEGRSSFPLQGHDVKLKHVKLNYKKY